MTTIDDCRLIDFPRIASRQGSITPLETGKSVPFPIARIFYIYDVPGGANRGGHAHREVEQMIVSCMSSFDVTIDDGTNRRTITLNRAYYGLYVPKQIWAELVNFSSGAVCLVLASELYEEEEYFRRYEDFLRFKRGTP
ncbi:MAG TPA: FdtA/QdtA family cupin domain-containing protein [Thermoanaerobaculia bacterium]|nr:FdtA/QdtA family cupin domain-containing protein [Thermoanaerobaculia bacterium]